MNAPTPHLRPEDAPRTPTPQRPATICSGGVRDVTQGVDNMLPSEREALEQLAMLLADEWKGQEQVKSVDGKPSNSNTWEAAC